MIYAGMYVVCGVLCASCLTWKMRKEFLYYGWADWLVLCGMLLVIWPLTLIERFLEWRNGDND